MNDPTKLSAGTPPPGGWGAPPDAGWGAPPDPAGGPPPFATPGFAPPPPRPRGPNAALLVGLGCGALVVLGAAGAAAFLLMARRPPAPPPGVAATATAGAKGSGPAPRPGAAGDLRAELRDLRDFKSEFGKARHLVGELVNTGDEPVGFLSAKVTVYDAQSTALDSGTCTTLVKDLAPGDKVPCTLSIFKVDTWASLKVDVRPLRASQPSAPDLTVSDTKLTPKSGHTPNTVEGKILNGSDRAAKNVWAVVSLYGADGKIVGADNALVAGNDLQPGQAGSFTARCYNVAAPPVTFQVRATGTRE